MTRATAARERHDAAAERVIKTAGLTFALAVSVGKVGDLADARALLKAAIISALADEFDIGQRDASGG